MVEVELGVDFAAQQPDSLIPILNPLLKIVHLFPQQIHGCLLIGFFWDSVENLQAASPDRHILVVEELVEDVIDDAIEGGLATFQQAVDQSESQQSHFAVPAFQAVFQRGES